MFHEKINFNSELFVILVSIPEFFFNYIENISYLKRGGPPET